jgi:hypothetical protein
VCPPFVSKIFAEEKPKDKKTELEILKRKKEEILKQINEYNVKIAFDIDDLFNRNGYVYELINELSDEVAALASFLEVLKMYPKKISEKVKSVSFYASLTLIKDGNKYAGYAETNKFSPRLGYVSLSIFKSSKGEVFVDEYTVHHEFAYQVDEIRWSEWNEHAYGVLAPWPSENSEWTKVNKRPEGFACNYGLKDFREDIATVAEFMFGNSISYFKGEADIESDHNFLVKVYSDKVLMKKLEYLMDYYQKELGIDHSFWFEKGRFFAKIISYNLENEFLANEKNNPECKIFEKYRVYKGLKK